ncbi:hypothetical protein KAJ87_01185 [Candidatus Pacearchaeota archaeon]|nr:hypothetical protein [Candidatus Pacearchaeota archaeon]
MEKKSDLENLKESYGKIKEKFNLPDFEKFNEDFQIEKLADVETDFLIREIRRFMADKFSNYLRFVEALLHPVNSPMFVFSIVKSIGIEEKNKLTDAYKKLAKIEVNLIELDIEFSEKKEIDFIKESYKVWQEIKKDLLKIVEVIKKNWDNKSEVNGKGYFG